MKKVKKTEPAYDVFYEFLSDLSFLLTSEKAFVSTAADGGLVLQIPDISLDTIFIGTLSRIVSDSHQLSSGISESDKKKIKKEITDIEKILNKDTEEQKADLKQLLKEDFRSKLMQPNSKKRIGDTLYLSPDTETLTKIESLFSTVGTHSPGYSAIFSGDKSGSAVFRQKGETRNFKNLVHYDSVSTTSPFKSLDFKIENASNAPYLNVLAMALLSKEDRETVFRENPVPPVFVSIITKFLDYIRSRYDLYNSGAKKNLPTIPSGPQILVPKNSGEYVSVSPLGSGKILNEIHVRIKGLLENDEKVPDFTNGYDLMNYGKATNNLYVVPVKVFVSSPPSINHDISLFFSLSRNSEKAFNYIAENDPGIIRKLNLLGCLAVRFDKKGAGGSQSFLREKKKNTIAFIAKRLAEEAKDSLEKYQEIKELDVDAFIQEMTIKICRWINTHKETLKKFKEKRVFNMRQDLFNQTYGPLIAEILETTWRDNNVGTIEI